MSAGFWDRTAERYAARPMSDTASYEAMLERVLREVAESYDEKNRWGSAEMTFPGVVALSHCWLALAHPDPDARNLREKWLPAIEWYYSERVKRAWGARDPDHYQVSEARKAAWAGVSDAELLERCDFAIFIDLTAMCQHPSPPAGPSIPSHTVFCCF